MLQHIRGFMRQFIFRISRSILWLRRRRRILRYLKEMKYYFGRLQWSLRCKKNIRKCEHLHNRHEFSKAKTIRLQRGSKRYEAGNRERTATSQKISEEYKEIPGSNIKSKKTSFARNKLFATEEMKQSAFLSKCRKGIKNNMMSFFLHLAWKIDCASIRLSFEI